MIHLRRLHNHTGMALVWPPGQPTDAQMH